MAAKKEGILEDICEGIGSFAGAALANAPAIVIGAYHAISKGSWEAGVNKWADTIEACAEEGGRVGRQHGPGVVLSTVVTLAAGFLGIQPPHEK